MNMLTALVSIVFSATILVSSGTTNVTVEVVPLPVSVIEDGRGYGGSLPLIVATSDVNGVETTSVY